MKTKIIILKREREREKIRLNENNNKMYTCIELFTVKFFFTIHKKYELIMIINIYDPECLSYLNYCSEFNIYNNRELFIFIY